MTMTRILLNPDTAEGGAASPGDDEGMVRIPASELEALRAAAAAAADHAKGAARDAERARSIEQLRDEEIARWSRKAEGWERACKSALKEKELAAALAGRSLVPGAASQLIKLWRDDLDVIDEAGAIRVSARDGRPVAEAVDAWLAGAEYAHFTRPGSRGGTTPPGNSRSTATAPAAAPPRNLGEAVLMRWRDAIRGSRQDLEAPIGLGRRRP